jgi:hypothetical protein
MESWDVQDERTEVPGCTILYRNRGESWDVDARSQRQICIKLGFLLLLLVCHFGVVLELCWVGLYVTMCRHRHTKIGKYGPLVVSGGF